jgi:Protein of unknown function (DUF3147)
MKVKIDTTGIKESRWYEYVVRFAFGGSVTAFTGVIAKHYGPAIGGLFLAFPAILPATATLIEKHEKEKKEQSGKNGTIRGRRAAGVDSAGAAMGSIGLAVFAVILWKELPASSLPIMLTAATVAWLVAAVVLWLLRETVWRGFVRRIHTYYHAHAAMRGAQSSMNRRLK